MTTKTLMRGKRVLIDPADDATGWIDDGAILVTGERVAEVGAFEVLRAAHPDARVLGDGTQTLLPGLIDAHSHGHGLSRIQAGVFFDFLENMITDWPWRVALPKDVAAALTAVRHLRAGFTTIHHFGWDDPGPGAIEASEGAVAEYLKAGIRLAYNPAVRNINRFACDEADFLKTLPDDLRALAEPLTDYDSEALEDGYFELFEHLHSKYDGGATRVLMGPSWAHGCTPKLLARVRDRAAELGRHDHPHPHAANAASARLRLHEARQVRCSPGWTTWASSAATRCSATWSGRRRQTSPCWPSAARRPRITPAATSMCATASRRSTRCSRPGSTWPSASTTRASTTTTIRSWKCA